jgi:hypothetical protein
MFQQEDVQRPRRKRGGGVKKRKAARGRVLLQERTGAPSLPYLITHLRYLAYDTRTGLIFTSVPQEERTGPSTKKAKDVKIRDERGSKNFHTSPIHRQ